MKNISPGSVQTESQTDGLTDVQTSRRTDGRRDCQIEVRVEGEDRSLSGSTRRGIAECVFGRDLTATSPVIVLIVCAFVLHRQGRMVYPRGDPRSIVVLAV